MMQHLLDPRSMPSTFGFPPKTIFESVKSVVILAFSVA